MAIELNESNHTARVDGRDVPRVTTILNAVLGGRGEWASAAMEAGMRRGRLAHELIAAAERGIAPDDPARESDLWPFVESWSRAKAALGRFEALCVEWPVARGRPPRYAGRIDMLARIDGRHALIDVKTGGENRVRDRLQMIAYREAVADTCGIAPTRLLLVYLRPAGCYSISFKIAEIGPHEWPTLTAAWNCAVALYHHIIAIGKEGVS